MATATTTTPASYSKLGVRVRFADGAPDLLVPLPGGGETAAAKAAPPPTTPARIAADESPPSPTPPPPTPPCDYGAVLQAVRQHRGWLPPRVVRLIRAGKEVYAGDQVLAAHGARAPASAAHILVTVHAVAAPEPPPPRRSALDAGGADPKPRAAAAETDDDADPAAAAAAAAAAAHARDAALRYYARRQAMRLGGGGVAGGGVIPGSAWRLVRFALLAGPLRVAAAGVAEPPTATAAALVALGGASLGVFWLLLAAAAPLFDRTAVVVLSLTSAAFLLPLALSSLLPALNGAPGPLTGGVHPGPRLAMAAAAAATANERPFLPAVGRHDSRALAGSTDVSMARRRRRAEAAAAAAAADSVVPASFPLPSRLPATAQAAAATPSAAASGPSLYAEVVPPRPRAPVRPGAAAAAAAAASPSSPPSL
jgi:hypothetical protein